MKYTYIVALVILILIIITCTCSHMESFSTPEYDALIAAGYSKEFAVKKAAPGQCVLGDGSVGKISAHFGGECVSTDFDEPGIVIEPKTFVGAVPYNLYGLFPDEVEFDVDSEIVV